MSREQIDCSFESQFKMTKTTLQIKKEAKLHQSVEETGMDAALEH